MFTRQFWRATAERALKTFAQSLAAVLGANGTGLWDAAWSSAVAVAAMATLLSLLSSVASAPAGADHQSPSLLREPQVPAAA